MIASELTTEAEGGQEVISWYADVTDDEESVEGSDIAQELVRPILFFWMITRTMLLSVPASLPRTSTGTGILGGTGTGCKVPRRGQTRPALPADARCRPGGGSARKEWCRSVAEAYRARSRSALPKGWRHEQLSALMVAARPKRWGTPRPGIAHHRLQSRSLGSPSPTTQASCSRKATCPRERTTRCSRNRRSTLQRRLLG